MEKLLTDISFWGEYPDFYQMSLNANGTILKAGQGGWIDPVFVENAIASKGLLPRGVYWFYDGRYKPSRQVDLLIEALKWSDFELPIFGDFEREYGGDYEGWIDFYNFMRILRERLPDAKLGVYTRTEYWETKIPVGERYRFKDFLFWVAHYTTDASRVKTPLPWSNRDKDPQWDMWQYTNAGDGLQFGLDPYVKRAIDLNKFKGDWIEFGGEDDGSSEPEPEPPSELYAGEIICQGSVNFRSGAGTMHPTLSPSKPHGTKMIIDEFDIDGLGESKWVHVIEIEGEPVDGYMASFWNGEVLIKISGIDEPTSTGIDYPYAGVMRERKGTTQVLTISDFDSFAISSPDGCLTVDKLDYDIACNGTGFKWEGCVPNQTVKVNGVMISPQYNYEPFAYWVNKSLEFSESSRTLKSVDNAISIRRYLVMDGVQNPNPSSAWDELHKWQLLGSGANGETIIISILDEVNLYEAARVMLENGVINGGDLDSGGSVQTKVGDDVITAEGRGVANFIGFTFAQKVEPPVVEDDVVGTVNEGINLSVRRGASVFSEKMTSLPSGTMIEIESILVEDDYTWAKWFVYSAVKKNDGSKTYIELDDTQTSGTVLEGINLSVRRGASTFSEKIALLLSGTAIEIDSVLAGDTYTWAKWPVYSAIKKNDGSKTYIDIESVPEPDPEPDPDPILLDPDNLVVPDVGDYMRFGHDFESHYWNFEPRSSDKNLRFRKDLPSSPLPDTAKGKIDRFNAMSKEWQFFWRDLCRVYVPHWSDAEFLEAMTSLTADTRAMTDNAAAENGYTNWITGQNITGGNGKNMEIKELAFGGNIVKVLMYNGSEITVEAFDPSKAPPTVEYAMTHLPHLIMWANVSTCYRLSNGNWDGRENAKPFPQLRDENGRKIGAPYPLMGLGGKIIFRKKSFTQKCLSLYPIGNGEKYSPYIYLS